MHGRKWWEGLRRLRIEPNVLERPARKLMLWQMCVDNYHFPKLTVPKFGGKIQNLMFLQFIKTWTWTFLPDSLAPLCCCRGENSQFFSKTILLFPSSLFLELSAKFQMEGLQRGLVGGSSVKERRKYFFKNCCTTSNFQNPLFTL